MKAGPRVGSVEKLGRESRHFSSDHPAELFDGGLYLLWNTQSILESGSRKGTKSVNESSSRPQRPAATCGVEGLPRVYTCVYTCEGVYMQLTSGRGSGRRNLLHRFLLHASDLVQRDLHISFARNTDVGPHGHTRGAPISIQRR